MEKKIQELIEISRFYGMDKEYVIAGGGNTSYKNSDTLWIKASGVALSNIDENGFVEMSRQKLQVISSASYSSDSSTREVQVKEDMLKAINVNNGLRPSVETSLHEIVSYPFVIHTHPTLVNAVLCSVQAREKSFELFGDEIMFIPYIDPGYVLFKEVSDSLSIYRRKFRHGPKIILLENHGIIVSAQTIDEVKAIYSQIENKILEAANLKLPSTNISGFTSGLVDQVKAFYPDDVVIEAVNNDLIKFFVESKDSFSEIETAFTPDHIVYCKARYLFLDETENLKTNVGSYQMKYGFLPKIIGVKNKGLIIVDDSVSAVNIITELIQNMMKISFYARAFGGSKSLTDKQIAFIENWEAENYRKKMSGKL